MANTAFKLEEAGFSREQIDALDEHWTRSAATKEDIVRLEGKLEAQGASLKGEINKLTWMFGVLVVINTGVGFMLVESLLRQ